MTGAYGEWVPVEKAADMTKAFTSNNKSPVTVTRVTTASSSGQTVTGTGLPVVKEQPVCLPSNDGVFPELSQQVRKGRGRCWF